MIIFGFTQSAAGFAHIVPFAVGAVALADPQSGCMIDEGEQCCDGEDGARKPARIDKVKYFHRQR